MTEHDSEALARLVYETERKLAEQIRVSAELEEALRLMELRALQAQINPHFLFNTLSSIAASSFMEGAPKTNELVQALARLIRYTLRQIGQMVELEEELKHVRDYLLIEKTRFGERIEVVIDVEPAVMTAKLPLLTLQPLVENAIIHGLEAKAGGVVTIKGRPEGDWVRLEVIDNGVGFDENRAREIMASREPQAGVSHVTGLGLDNVRRRLEHAFGEESGLALTSRVAEGTVATLRIPGPPPPDPGPKRGEEKP